MFATVPSSPWLYPEEQAEVVRRLVELGLVKFDNARSLPLKSGGKTDVYINLRDMRNRPDATRFLAEVYAIPLRRLGVSGFVEVPEAVSGLAGHLSVVTNLPYITIRAELKEGRVSDAKVIGNPDGWSSAALLDDVVTDGASKVGPLAELERRGLNCKALVVLVDRQQGWQANFAGRGITVSVWAGMTLHNVRLHLIQTLGVMQRCDPAVEEKNPLIIALDGKSWDEVLPIIDVLRPTGCILKVNDLLVARGAEWLLSNLAVYGRVMADLKIYDIKQTALNIAERVRDIEPLVWAVTVHASGQVEMIQAIVEVFRETPVKVLAVTVLTSFNQYTCEEVYTRQPLDQVKVLARIAWDAGAHGFVCSPQEAGELRALYPEATIVTPGVRSPGVDAHEQERIGTPAGAMEAGANHLVMGRQIMTSPDPFAEVRRVLTEELGIAI